VREALRDALRETTGQELQMPTRGRSRADSRLSNDGDSSGRPGAHRSTDGTGGEGSDKALGTGGEGSDKALRTGK